jgi:hypothetical protein
MSGQGQKAKYSRRAHVFRFGPNNGHRSIGSACPFGAITGLMHASPFDHLVGATEQCRGNVAPSFSIKLQDQHKMDDKPKHGETLPIKMLPGEPATFHYSFLEW